MVASAAGNVCKCGSESGPTCKEDEICEAGACVVQSSPLSTGAIVGIVIGCVVAVALIVGAVVFVVMKKRKSSSIP